MSEQTNRWEKSYSMLPRRLSSVNQNSCLFGCTLHRFVLVLRLKDTRCHCTASVICSSFLLMTSEYASPQFTLFKDCLAKRLVAKSGVLDESQTEESATDLDDFVSYLCLEVWPGFPQKFRDATHENRTSVPIVDSLKLVNTPTSFIDTLTSCGISDDSESALVFLKKVLEDYLSEACAPPPMWFKTRTTECEICEREIPLTYHHLIPRETHAKVLKKKWHSESMLNSAAWLCR